MVDLALLIRVGVELIALQRVSSPEKWQECTVDRTIEVQLAHSADVGNAGLHLLFKVVLASSQQVHFADDIESVVIWPQCCAAIQWSIGHRSHSREYAFEWIVSKKLVHNRPPRDARSSEDQRVMSIRWRVLHV